MGLPNLPVVDTNFDAIQKMEDVQLLLRAESRDSGRFLISHSQASTGFRFLGLVLTWRASSRHCF